MNKHISI